MSLAQRLRLEGTNAERILWRHLRSRQFLGEKFRRQHPTCGFVIDFYCETLKLAVEVDGGQHEIQAERDATRTAALARDDVKVVRFWNNDVLKDIDGVLARLAEIVEQRRQELGRS